MKIIAVQLMSFLILSICFSPSFAKDTSATSSKWTCENNASSSSTSTNSTDMNSSNATTPKPMSAMSAFEKSYKTCNDCDKITCTLNK